MKRFSLLFALLVAFIVLTGCFEKTPKLTSISVTGTKENYDESFDLSDLILNLEMSDGSKSQVPLTESMINANDLTKLSQEGTHTINVSYQNLATSFTITITGEKGEPGEDGKEVTFRVQGDMIQWQYIGDATWKNLIALATLTGPAGIAGTNGKTPEFQITATHIQWRYVGDATWVDLLALTTLVGPQGPIGPSGTNGKDGTNGTNGTDGKSVDFRIFEGKIQWQYVGGSTWTTLINVDELKGEDGQQGSTPIITISDDGYWVIDGVKSDKKAITIVETKTITFDATGGELPENFTLTISAIKGDTIDLPIPTRQGYNFLGWFTGNTVNDGKFTTVTQVTKDITLYARWDSLQDKINQVYKQTLKTVDSHYRPNMKNSDFFDDFDYQYYLSISEMLLAYSEMAISANLSVDQAMELFETILMLPEAFSDFESISSIHDVLARFSEYNISNCDIATIILDLGNFALSMSYTNNEENIMLYNDEKRYRSIELQNILESAYYQNIKDWLYTYSDYPEYIDSFAADFGNAQLNETLYMAVDAARIMIYQPDFDMTYYQMNGDPYFQMIYSALKNAYNDDPGFLYQLINNGPYSNATFGSFANANGAYRQIVYCEDRIKELNFSSQLLLEFKQALELNYSVYQDQILEVLNYLTFVHNSLPSDLLERLDLLTSGTLSMEEIIILKDEIVNVLIDTLPPVSYFEKLYTTMFYTLAAFTPTGLATEEYLVDIQTLALHQHGMSNLLLNFILKIDADTIADIMIISEELYTPGYPYYDPEFGEMWIEAQINPDKLIDLLLYIGNFVKDYVALHQDEIAQLPNLETAYLDIINILVPIVKGKLEQVLQPEEYEMVASIIDQLLPKLPNIIDGLDVFGDIALELICQFLDSEGEFFRNIIEILNSPDFPEAYLIEAMIDTFIPYNEIIMGRSDEDILAILDMAFVPVKIYLTTIGIVTGEEFDQLYSTLVTDAVDILRDFSKLEMIILETLGNAQFEELMQMDSIMSPMDVYLIASFKALSELFVTQDEVSETEDLIYGIIDKIVTLVTRPDLSEFIGFTPEDGVAFSENMDRVKLIFEQAIAGICEIQEIEDLSQITTEQIDYFWSIFENFISFRIMYEVHFYNGEELLYTLKYANMYTPLPEVGAPYGYVFEGWFQADNPDVVFKYLDISCEISLYAKFAVDTYIIVSAYPMSFSNETYIINC